jgi:hypothetical protein
VWQEPQDGTLSEQIERRSVIVIVQNKISVLNLESFFGP